MFSEKGPTVSLLDDDTAVLKATSRLLRSAGWEAEAFNDPVQFLDYASSSRPRVVVLDMLMPVMNGLEVQDKLRRISPSTQVVILTSKDDEVTREKATEQGAIAFLTKPVVEEEFLSAIETAFSKDNGPGQV
ncbi:MAG: response regulator transcription factor [Chthoniobacterales bacterium]